MKATLILGNMLFPDLDKYKISKKNKLIMIESCDLINHFKYHKHKLILFLSAMREYKNYLENQGFEVIYKKFEENRDVKFTQTLKKIIKKENITEIHTFTIEDHFFRKELKQFFNKENIKLTQLISPGFLTSLKKFKEFSEIKKNFIMNDFYIWQRKRLNILIDENKKPLGGKWSFDEENRKKTPRDYKEPKFSKINPTRITQEVMNLIDKEFSQNPGNSKNFYLPTTRTQALSFLDEFIKYRFKDFGVYEDAIDNRSSFLNHSVLSPIINLGLLTPKEIIEKIIELKNKYCIPINSLEGFIRQIIGWRELMRGMYHTKKLKGNFLNHNREFTIEFYEGKTGIIPLDNAIKKAENLGYTHHIERLMIIGNFMLLCEIKPNIVYKFFMEYYVDSSDWIMVPNVYSMSQFSDGGTFATKPYIGGSNYILKMSHYKKGSWCDIWDGLYWRFIDKNRNLFENNYRMSMMVKLLDKMNKEKKEKIFKAAKDFLDKYTIKNE